MNQKIVIIGAGHGGLYAAKLLAQAGNEVTVYEKSAYDCLSHDRTDCIEMKLFEETGLPIPQGSYKGHCCSFVGPFTDEMLYIFTKEEIRDVTVGRKAFAHMLIQRAEESGVKFVYETEVDSLIVEGIKVKGIRIEEKEIRADLVIDASGLMSPFRAQVPEIAGLTAMPDEDEVFSTFHASYQWKKDVPLPQDKAIWKLYLKYQGKKGISWVNCERENDAAVLIGLIGKLSQKEYTMLFDKLKQDNPIIGDELIMGGQYAPISVRYPASVLVSEGYALIGDSAFMTIPLLGSGLANAIRAGQYLADAIIANNTVDIRALWQYQLTYFQKIGGISCIIDSVKRALLDMENADLKYIIESGMITDDDVKAILNGNIKDLDIKALLKRLSGLLHVKGAVKILVKYVNRGIHAALLTTMMPKQYSLLEVNHWKKRFDHAMKKNG